MKLWWSLANAWVHAVTALRNVLVFDTIGKLLQLCDRRAFSVVGSWFSAYQSLPAIAACRKGSFQSSCKRAEWVIGVGHTANV